MAHLLELPNLRDGYVELCEYVIRAGHYAEPRKSSTLEVEDVTFTIGDLTDCLPVGIGRGINLEVAAIEALQVIGRVATPKMMIAASPHFAQFAESGEFYGAYGVRVGNQTGDVIDKLRADSDSRQAIITIWNPKLDNEPGHKDYPCTIALGFRLRKDRLNLSVVMRSNDVWWGVGYDPFQFTQLQWTLANELGVEPGSYTHTAWSLHAYERDFNAIGELINKWKRLGDLDESSIAHVRGVASRTRARQIVAGNHPDDSDDSERWYAIRMKKIMQKLEAESA